MNYLATFFTHSGAIKFSRALSKDGIENESLPVPRKLSSNCGIGVKFLFQGEINSILNDDIEKLFKVTGKDDFTLYLNFDE